MTEDEATYFIAANGGVPTALYQFGGVTLERFGWTRWGAWSGSRGVGNCRTPFGALIGLTIWRLRT